LIEHLTEIGEPSALKRPHSLFGFVQDLRHLRGGQPFTEAEDDDIFLILGELLDGVPDDFPFHFFIDEMEGVLIGRCGEGVVEGLTRAALSITYIIDDHIVGDSVKP